MLADAIQGRTHTPAEIVWIRRDDTPQDLTGATLSAAMVNRRTKVVRAATGVFAVQSAVNGVFTWTYSDADVADAGDFLVQFTATYGDGTADSTFQTAWTVRVAL